MKHTRLFLLALLVFAFSLSVNAQSNMKTWEKLKARTLLVPIEDEGSVKDQAMMNAIEKYWKFSPYKFVKKEELEKLQLDPKYSFLLAFTYSDNYITYKRLGICLAKPKVKSIYVDKPEVIDYFNLPDFEFINKTYTSLIIQNLNTTASNAYSNEKIGKVSSGFNGIGPVGTAQGDGSPSISSSEINTYFTLKKEQLFEKTILISKEEFSKEVNFDEDEFITSFKKNVKVDEIKYLIVEPEEIETALKKGDENVAILCGIQYDLEKGKCDRGRGRIYSAKDARLLAFVNLEKPDRKKKIGKIVLGSIVAVALWGVVIFYAFY